MGDQFVRCFRRTGLEEQAELRIGVAADIDGQDHRLRRPATMIASQGGDRRQGCERNKAGRDENFTDAMDEGHDR